MDDGHSYNHENGQYLLTEFLFSNNTLTAKPLRLSRTPQPSTVVKEVLGCRVERLIIVGLRYAPKSIIIRDDMQLEFETESAAGGVVVTVKDPKVFIGDEWEIEVEKK